MNTLAPVIFTIIFRGLTVIGFLFYFPSVLSQDLDYFNETYLRFEDFTYKENIKTVMFYNESALHSPPFINLDSEDNLILHFDELDNQYKLYTYKVIHCTFDWKKSELLYTDYISGYQEDEITYYQFSFNTKQTYIHYILNFPNNNMKPLISGNYILMVYDNFDENNIIITRRFMVVDTKIGIISKVNRSFRNKIQCHEIDFDIQKKNYPVNNPHTDIKVVITQNFRWDNAITSVTPVLFDEEKLIYDLFPPDVFAAGNEYRWFDFRSLRYLTKHVKDIMTVGENEHHIILNDDRIKNDKLFKSDEQDMNGRYVIMVQEGDNIHTEADYAYIHFKLLMNNPSTDGGYYLIGSFTDNTVKKEFMLTYNYDQFAYEKTILLKQGLYNYQYAFVKDGCKNGDVSFTEGSYFETENIYTIYIYHHEWGSKYDQLIGMKFINTENLQRMKE